MGRAYSQDLRDRVINAVVKDEGLSCRAAAKQFGIGVSSAIRWVSRYQLKKERCPIGTGGHRPSKLKPHKDWLLTILKAKPDITLAAMAEKFLTEKGVKATTGMMSYFFIREGISFKKKRFAK